MFDAVATHNYWSTAGLTRWNATRWRLFPRPSVPILVTECGRDKVRDGPNGTYLPSEAGENFGWQAQGIDGDAFLRELADFDAELRRDGVYAVVFTTSPDDEWGRKGFSVDDLADRCHGFTNLGPHDLLGTSPQALAWAAVAPIVKSCDQTAAIRRARPDAITVYRRRFSVTEQAIYLDMARAGHADAAGGHLAGAIIVGLDGFRHPRLVVELLNEVGSDRRDDYLALCRAAIPVLRAAGLAVAGPSWGTGDYEDDDWWAFALGETLPPPAPAPEVRPMRKRCYLWQFDQLGESSVAEIAATLRLGGVAEVACKTHQGLTWLGAAADTSPLAFRSLTDVRDRFNEFANHGIRMVPWCVPTGADVAAEASLAADVADVCGNVIELDLEPYTGFWEGPYENLTPYTQAIEAEGARYEVNFDARASGWQPFGAAPFALACARAEAVWTQSYWTDFQRDAEAVVADALATLALLEVPPEKAGVIYPWDGPQDYDRVTRRIQQRMPLVQKIGMWRMGTAGPAVYAALARIPTTAPDAPPAAVDYEALAWSPIYRAHEALLATGEPEDAALALSVHNAMDLHKRLKGRT